VNVTTRLPLLLAVALAGPLLAACSSGGDGVTFPKTVVVKDGQVQPILANSELVVGENRVAVGVLSAEGRPIVDARVHFAFYDLNDGKQVKKSEMDAVSRVPARDAGIVEQVEHIHADGTKHTHFNAGDDIGIYTAVVSFDRPGEWGVAIKVDSDNPKVNNTLTPRFNVLTRGPTPPIGSPAPKSRNLTAADVSDISQIDSSATPSPEMHTSTIAAAVAAGKPTLVLFAVPGFCDSRLCGPELEIMRKLYPKYRDKAEFIHVEFYKDPGSPSRTPADAVQEWNLRTEPWFFLVDTKGNVAAKFEGPTSLQELDEALQKIVPTT
jgi:hypothetical protein